MTSLLDFYQQHGISPVGQDITDLPAHFARRAFLYRQLGLPPMAVRRSTVLEVGPGSGENALYTASLRPFHYVLLEPNEIGRQRLTERLARHDVTILPKTVQEFRADEYFDLVLCEGLLGLCGGDPLALLSCLTPHVAKGGVLVVTCIDPISDHSEVLRRALAHSLIEKSQTLAEQIAILRPVFAPHLATLKGMTRSVDDWIVDNLLNPASIGPTFSIPQACEALDDEFDLLGCSPRFLVDWRWYKEGGSGNQWAIDAYWKQAHNLFDYRKSETEHSEAITGGCLFEWCQTQRALAKASERDGSGLIVTRFKAIQDDPGWFGRGQQYLSFVKR